MKKIQDMKFEMNEACDFEETTGTPLITFFSDERELRMTDTRALVKAGLGVTEIEAGNIITSYLKENDMNDLFELIFQKLDEGGILKAKKKK